MNSLFLTLFIGPQWIILGSRNRAWTPPRIRIMYILNLGLIVLFPFSGCKLFSWSAWASPNESWTGDPLNPRVHTKERWGRHTLSYPSPFLFPSSSFFLFFPSFSPPSPSSSLPLPATILSLSLPQAVKEGRSGVVVGRKRGKRREEEKEGEGEEKKGKG